MKNRIVFLLLFVVIPLFAQNEFEGQHTEKIGFKPRYAGTGIDAGVMFTSGIGPAYYLIPKISFQTTPRLFVNAGIGVMNYSLLPAQNDFYQARNVTNIFLFAEGQYFLSERWSINGSVMKDVSQGSLRNVSPYCMPKEAMHIGVDYKITPNITVGARIGYSNGSNRNINNSFYPF